jgi:BirA family biotin operon repressor/biotin-[acetyl-CoA-carboxylase] ligase
MAIFAHEQVAGKGQRGKAWASQKEANIILSLVINPQPLPLSDQFQLSACAAVAVLEFFRKYAGDDSKIKWPNDLYWQDRKAGGILIESVIGGEADPDNNRDPVSAAWKWSIIGIGININQTSFHPEIKNPVSLKQITGKEYDVVELAKELSLLFYQHLSGLVENGFAGIYATYLAHLYKKNETVKLKKGTKVFPAVIEGVSPAGQLITHQSLPEGPVTTGFDFGEVEWIIE